MCTLTWLPEDIKLATSTGSTAESNGDSAHSDVATGKMAAAFTFGMFGPFLDESEEDFETYLQRFEHYLKASCIEDENSKRSAYLTVVGRRSFKVLKDLGFPCKSEEKSYDEIVAVLTKHYQPEVIDIAERFVFGEHKQEDGEKVSAYSLALKELVMRCNFGSFRDQALTGRFIVGLRDPATQKELLRTKGLTFQAALATAKRNEQITHQTKQFRCAERESNVINAVTKWQQSRSKGNAANAATRKPKEQEVRRLQISEKGRAIKQYLLSLWWL